MDPIPPDVFLDAYPPPIAAIGNRLRAAVAEALPGVVERVRTGWRIVGFDAPNGRRLAYFAWVMPEARHIHLGFVHGALMADPDGRLGGAGITKQARWLTFEPGDPVDARALAPLIREGARVACLSRGERALAALVAAGDG